MSFMYLLKPLHLSFLQEKRDNAGSYNGLFSTLLADRVNFGVPFLNALQLNNQYLMRYMVASFLLSRSIESYDASNQKITVLDKDVLHEVALPIIMSEKGAYSDNFTKFVEQLFEEFDFEEATRLAYEIEKDAEKDVLLRGFAKQIRKQAILYIFQVQARLYKQVDFKEYCQQHKLDEAQFKNEVQSQMKTEGFVIGESGDSLLNVESSKFDVQGQIQNKTVEIVKRTQALNQAYTN